MTRVGGSEVGLGAVLWAYVKSSVTLLVNKGALQDQIGFDVTGYLIG